METYTDILILRVQDAQEQCAGGRATPGAVVEDGGAIFYLLDAGFHQHDGKDT